jgi:hypothetical protein
VLTGFGSDIGWLDDGLRRTCPTGQAAHQAIERETIMLILVRQLPIAVGIAAFLCAAPFSIEWSQNSGVALSVTSAHARIGRPLTPGSVAGVARRTTRRTVRRHAYVGAAAVGAAAVGTAVVVGAAVAALPANCAAVIYGGARYYHCHGYYYQPSGGSYVVVPRPY